MANEAVALGVVGPTRGTAYPDGLHHVLIVDSYGFVRIAKETIEQLDRIEAKLDTLLARGGTDDKRTAAPR